MINVSIYFQKNKIFGFNVKGHANFDDYGNDIVCSAVTSCVMMSCNALTELLNQPCHLKVKDNEIDLFLKPNILKESIIILNSLHLHLKLLSEDYGKNLIINVVEV